MCVSRPAYPKQDLIEALSGGDAARATDAMRKHILSSMTRAMERLQP
jgi:DNA-binding GntR family transcriptional regulator